MCLVAGHQHIKFHYIFALNRYPDGFCCSFVFRRLSVLSKRQNVKWYLATPGGITPEIAPRLWILSCPSWSQGARWRRTSTACVDGSTKTCSWPRRSMTSAAETRPAIGTVQCVVFRHTNLSIFYCLLSQIAVYHWRSCSIVFMIITCCDTVVTHFLCVLYGATLKT